MGKLGLPVPPGFTISTKACDFFYNSDKKLIFDMLQEYIKKLKIFLRSKGFKAKVWCDDGSSNFISLLTKKFAGSDIWAIAKI